MSKLSAACFLAYTALAPAGQLRSQEAPSAPQLLLNSQRIRRLSRDRERQTIRWQNFEKRVVNTPDSPQRGFELALYSVITHDSGKATEAIRWATAHPCDARQRALVLDWAQGSPDDVNALRSVNCSRSEPSSDVVGEARDKLFAAVASGQDVADVIAKYWPRVQATLRGERALTPESLMALCEFLLAARALQHSDLRESDSPFFSSLPKVFLLNLKPSALDNPDWQTHVAALELVALDPNLENSQFVQGWAMEDRHMIREGPGVGWELLWADPYLPGIAYQNMDSWVYDGNGHLLARSDWDTKACWLKVDNGRYEQENCPTEPNNFGSLSLFTLGSNCLDVPPRRPNSSWIVWKLKPHAEIRLQSPGASRSSEADSSGLFYISGEFQGKACLAHKSRS